ncbi:hypothetical protein RJT34_04466 [Clitoria ternatea]|uniref:FHA domain-containing protein n=1 Tax=Clitoria ternatea TaxID=43366 RepID=A0AAN9KMQ4_CLITE
MAEEEEVEAPSLRLEILQGPRQGETLDFPPGTAVRIGRVVRGNTLPIKDSGISSKHLTILTQSNKWILQDLNSSNGTVFDGSQIPPHTPFTLYHGSTIKIGELTSIHVTFLHQHHHARRNPTRRGRTGTLEPDPTVEASSEPVSKPKRGRGRGKPLKARVQIQSIDENASVEIENEPGQLGRPASVRVTRKSRKNRSVAAVSESSVENLEKVEEQIEQQKNTRSPSLVVISDSRAGNSNKDPPEEKPRVTRVTRNSKKNTRSVVEKGKDTRLECGVENVEKRKTRGGAGKSELLKECVEVEGETNEGFCGEEETCDERGKENVNGDGENGNANWPDLEKMSFGEWFDFLEVHLPKQIIDASEEMIGSMTQKAERLRDYIATVQQNDKVKMSMEK